MNSRFLPSPTPPLTSPSKTAFNKDSTMWNLTKQGSEEQKVTGEDDAVQDKKPGKGKSCVLKSLNTDEEMHVFLH